MHHGHRAQRFAASVLNPRFVRLLINKFALVVSVLKFIEHNWKFGTGSSRSRDNLPNPIAEIDLEFGGPV